MRRRLLNKITVVGLVLMSIGGAMVNWAQAQSGAIEVDVELVLAVDVSRSMSPRELEIQRRGYAEALTSDDVVAAIEGGLIGQIALRYIEWAGDGSQRVIVDWSLIGGRSDAERFAAQLVAQFDPTLRRTSISSALDYSRRSFDTNGFTASRRVIDISGDGPNNSGGPVLEARQRALDAGIVINGLPLMTRDGIYSRFDLPDLDNYYRECVIGGPASFVIPVTRWDQFPTAVRQKLIQELAAIEPAEPMVKRIAFHQKAEPAYDCLIGEKMWRQRRLDWGDDL
ncbi:MAG: DUF1194 domain-containing protein [Rhizobiaceae bacterium]|nr:DUF1194 domain-containing protein [Rhizobiaceae bacterium]